MVIVLIGHLEYVENHAEFFAHELETALAARDRHVTVTAAKNSLTVWCGTNYLGRVTYAALAADGMTVAVDTLITSWADDIRTPPDR